MVATVFESLPSACQALVFGMAGVSKEVLMRIGQCKYSKDHYQKYQWSLDPSRCTATETALTILWSYGKVVDSNPAVCVGFMDGKKLVLP